MEQGTINEAYNIDWTAIAGIAGTLIGVVVGSIATWIIQKKQIENSYKLQKRQLEHADKTRFHDKKMELYAEFISTAMDLATFWQINPEK